MSLRQELIRQGYWLFRWRSYLPLILLPLFAAAFFDGEYLETRFGAVAGIWWEWLSIGVAFGGLAMRALTVGFVPRGTSGRNTRAQKADALNRTGMYSVVRHPQYLANYVGFVGILMFMQVPWLILAASLAYWMYYERIMYAEEDFLHQKFGAVFDSWATITPAVLPNLRLWKRPALHFSLRSVLAREYPSWFATAVTLSAIEVLGSIFEREIQILDRAWAIFLTVGILLYLLVRFLKKHTRLLRVEGR